MKLKTWIKRAARTFVGTVSAGIVAAVSGAGDMEALKVALLSLLASAVSAGAAAVMNFKEK